MTGLLAFKHLPSTSISIFPCSSDVTSGAARIPGIKIQDARRARLREVLLHTANQMQGFSTVTLHKSILASSRLSANDYPITQLRYGLRKMKARGLILRNGHHYTYRLTDKGIKVSRMFVLFPQRVCGPLANSLLHHKPAAAPCPTHNLEKAYHKAAASIQHLVDLLAA